MQEYLQLPQESNAGITPPKSWPSTDATINIQDLRVRYAVDLDLVLKGVSVSIPARSRVAIVGRTGSGKRIANRPSSADAMFPETGKSTLALCFFRFLEAETGRISIDGLDISTIALHELRSRLTIIPQDAVLFSGSLRFNLDPFNEHEDIELWSILARVHLLGPTPSSTPRRPRSPANDEHKLTTDEPEERHSIKSLDDPVAEGGWRSLYSK